MTSQTKTKFIIGCIAAFLILIVCCVSGFILFRSQFIGSGTIVSEDRNPGAFTRIRLETPAELILTQGDLEQVTVEAEDNLMPRLVTEIRNGNLVLRTETAFINIIPTKPVIFRATIKDLEGVTITTSGSLTSERLQTGNFDLNIIGSADVDMDLFADNTTVTIDGSGQIRLSGNSNDQSVTINGSGSYDSANMRSRTCTSNINGSGKITLNCRQELSIGISGSGEVLYYGSPSITNQTISGSGKIQSLGEPPR